MRVPAPYGGIIVQFGKLLTLATLGALLASTSSIAAGKAPAGATSEKKAAATAMSDGPFWAAHPTPEGFTKMQDERLAKAQKLVDRLGSSPAPHTIDNTLRVYDDVLRELDQVGAQASLIENVHPDKAMREAAEKTTQKASAFGTELSLNRAVYDALAAMDISKADAETRYYVEHTLKEFRLSGVDKDEATRAKVKTLNEELVLIGQEFSRNIREDSRKVIVKNAAELDGLPDDYIARHKPDAEGNITLTTDYPDAIPVFSYAKSEDLRKRMFMEYNNRAYPKNMDVLDRLVAKRHELATLLGFPSWAEYITANKMVGSAGKASEFIDQIVQASTDRAAADYRVLLKRKQQDVPGATVVNAWESGYYSELLRKSEYDFDAQKMRPYFPYERVKQGVLDVTSKLFSVTYRKVDNAPVWDSSVDCYEMLENGKLVGRFYLDMHPREDKYNHAAQFDIRTGLAGRQIPEAALICNFPGGQANDPGLMEINDVTTFFHEFGHLLHTLFAGRHRWVGTGGIRTEHDFVEAPSQMLEEWMKDAPTLATFAKHYETNEPLPASMVAQMKRANEFGKGLAVRRQMVYAKTSLSIYDRPPAEVNTDQIIQSLTEKYQPFPFVPGTHFQCAFGHLEGYSAVYYTYMWSLVIAKDMFSKFDKSNLLDPEVALQYRNAVLAPGGSAPAADLVAHFLGRPYNFEAYKQWLNEDAGAAAKAN
jgi:thimet oligopeptidase